MMIMQIAVVTAILLIVPFLCGQNFRSFLEPTVDTRLKSVLFSWMSGWLVVMAVFFPLALLVTIFRPSLRLLTLAWGLVLLILMIRGLIQLFRGKRSFTGSKTKPVFSQTQIFWIVAIALIAFQVIMVLCFQHRDDDDALYVAQALLDLRTNTVGVYIGVNGIPCSWKLQLDYALAPWPVMWASLAQLTGLHPTILMHTVLPPILIVLAYVVYYFIGTEFFKAEGEKIAVFMMIYALINLFAAFSTRSPSMFLLLRVWQGKAVMSAILIPLLFVLLCRYETERNKANMLMVFLCNLAIMLTSGNAMMDTAIIWGCVALGDLIHRRSILRLLSSVWFMIPNVIVVALYLFAGHGGL